MGFTLALVRNGEAVKDRCHIFIQPKARMMRVSLLTSFGNPPNRAACLLPDVITVERE